MCAHNYTMKKSCLSNIMSYFIVPDSIIMKQDQADFDFAQVVVKKAKIKLSWK